LEKERPERGTGMKKVITLILIGFAVLACNSHAEKEQEVKEQHEKHTPDINYLGVSVNVAIETKKALGSELKAALKRGGVEEAVSYCNVNALPLTDSIAQRYNATIRRATDKPRNPANKATAMEMRWIEQFKTEIAHEGKVNASVTEVGDSVHFFAPIAIEALCLTCHGTLGEELTVDNYTYISDKYPDDKAINYSLDDLRGVWHISYPKLD
jgi:hypothetical protein